MKKFVYILFITVSLNSLGQQRNCELAHTLNAVIPSNAENNDIVVELNCNHAWDTVSAITWSILTNSDDIYSLSSDSLIISDNTDLAVGTDTIIFQIEDSYYNDYDTIFVTIIDASGTVEFIDLDAAGGGSGTRADPYNSLDRIDAGNATANCYYFIKRGSVDTLSETMRPDETIHLCAYGRGVRPIIQNAASDTSIWFYNEANSSIRDIKWEMNAGLTATYFHHQGGYDVDNCIFEGGHSSDAYNALRAVSVDGLDIRNSKFYNTTTDGMHLIGANILLESCHIYNVNSTDAGGDCAQIVATDNTEYENYEVRYCFLDHRAYHDKHTLIFQGCEDCAADSILAHDNRIIGYLSNNKAVSFVDCNNVYLYKNYIKNANLGTDFYSQENHGFENVYIYQNIYDSINAICIQLHTGDFTNINIYNNTFFDWGYTTSESKESAIDGSNKTDIDIYNNIFDTHGHCDSIFYEVSVSVDEDYNLANPDFGNWSEGGNSVEGAPAFVDTTINNFRLKSTSPAIDAGTDMSLTKDIKGYIIPQGTAPDMGAHERIIDRIFQIGGKEKWIIINNRKFVIK